MESTHWWGHGFGFMWFIPLFFFVVLIMVLRSLFGQGAPGCGSNDGNESHRDNAREILDKRFAKGEITKDEYEEMKKTLESDSS